MSFMASNDIYFVDCSKIQQTIEVKEENIEIIDTFNEVSEEEGYQSTVDISKNIVIKPDRDDYKLVSTATDVPSGSRRESRLLERVELEKVAEYREGPPIGKKLKVQFNGRNRSGLKKFECKICGCEFAFKNGLKMHKRIHAGKKPYKCRMCGYKCVESGRLKVHMRKHTGEKPYKCRECGYGCIQSCDLKKHMRVHSGEKPYQCRMCDYKCAQSGTLKTHIRTHTREKPFKCKTCEYECTKSSDLKRHMRIHMKKKSS